MYDERTTLSRQVATICAVSLEPSIQKRDPRNVRLAEAPSFGKPIIFYDIHSKGAEGYTQLAQEVIANARNALGRGSERSFGSLSLRVLQSPHPHILMQLTPAALQRLRLAKSHIRAQQVDIDLVSQALPARTRFREEALDELARSIQASGSFSARCRPVGSRYQLIAGDGVARSQRAGLTKVPSSSACLTISRWK